MKELNEIQFLYGFTEQDEYEMQAKGYRDDILVSFKDGTQKRLCFYDSVRLSQDIEDEKEIFVKGLVIVDELTRDKIFTVVEKMIANRYFED